MLLTILTPTYNRGNLLEKAYISLCNQTDKDFEWLIIDDGSTDNTRSIIKSFINEKKVDIKYFKKKNGGKHTAVNLGIKKSSGKLTIILDSDDILVEDAVEIIRNTSREYQKNKKIASFSFLKASLDNSIIGDKYPANQEISNYIDMRLNKKIVGDKAEVFITEVLNIYEYPVFEDEKFIGESYLWIKISRNFETVYVNKVIYKVKYLEDGLSGLGRVVRIKSPKGGMVHANEFLKHDIKLKYRFKYSLLYVTYSFLSGKKAREILSSRKELFIIFNIFNGFLLAHYWKFKYKHN